MDSFTNHVTRFYTEPPRDDGDPNGFYAHAYLGRHAKFRGRKYRRGKARCLRCGAQMKAGDGPPDPDRHLSGRARIVKNIMTPNPLLEFFRRHHA